MNNETSDRIDPQNNLEQEKISGERKGGPGAIDRTERSRTQLSGRYTSEQLESWAEGGSAALWGSLLGFGAGLATMYYLDPNFGARRRALLADKFTSASHRLPDAFRVAERDILNRTQGVWAEVSRMFSNDNPSDQVVEARVRSKMGRVCSHPHAVHVASNDGVVTLDGVILADEVTSLLKAVESVPGVKSVENKLQEHGSRGDIPSLQGGTTRESRHEFMQENWSPAARVLAGALGSAALAYGFTRRDLPSIGLGAAGAALLARSATNTEIKRLVGTGGGRNAVTIDKSIRVDAPPEVLFELWSNFENFPLFMSNVLEVTNVDDNVSHWKVAGPAGIPVQWDAEITKIVPNQMIAWKSVPGSTVANAGYVLFESNDDGSTEVTVRISYNPPAGAIGHYIAKAFGADPKSEMDQDLMRMKTYLETGRLPHDAGQNAESGGRRNTVH